MNEAVSYIGESLKPDTTLPKQPFVMLAHNPERTESIRDADRFSKIYCCPEKMPDEPHPDAIYLPYDDTLPFVIQSEATRNATFEFFIDEHRQLHDSEHGRFVENAIYQAKFGIIQNCHTVTGRSAWYNRLRNLDLISRGLYAVGATHRFTAVCLAAGPSLTQACLRLKNQVVGQGDRVLIIACDAAVPVLIKHGIRPHVVTTIDLISKKSALIREAKKAWPGVLIMAGIDCHYRLARACGPGTIWVPSATPVGIALRVHFAKTIKDRRVNAAVLTDLMPVSQPNVGNFQVEMAALLGARTIICAGYDFGFPGGLVHAKGCHHVWGPKTTKEGVPNLVEEQGIGSTPGMVHECGRFKGMVKDLTRMRGIEFISASRGLDWGVPQKTNWSLGKKKKPKPFDLVLVPVVNDRKGFTKFALEQIHQHEAFEAEEWILEEVAYTALHIAKAAGNTEAIKRIKEEATEKFRKRSEHLKKYWRLPAKMETASC